MTEAFVNPLDPQNFSAGGGLWDGQTVTVTESKFGINRFNKNDEANTEVVQNVWYITGIADNEEVERQQRYSIGSLRATDDGESFTKPDGSPGTLHKSSAGAKFVTGLVEGGFDISTLVADEKVVASKLNGARIEFAAVQRNDINGKPKINDKGYPVNDFYPIKFHGYADGATSPKAVDETVKKAAETLVLELLNAAENKTMTQAEIVRGVSSKMNGDPNSAAIIGLVISDEFKANGPWSRDGNSLTAIPF